MTVIDFKAAQQNKEPHSEGKARCMKCQHEWTAVAPAETERLECPNCSLMFGRFLYPFERDLPHWTCGCGNSVFYVTPDGTYCPACGAWQIF